jgi:hypothetical protein
LKPVPSSETDQILICNTLSKSIWFRKK